MLLHLLLSCSLIAPLGDRAWRVRERAHRALAALGPLARPALERAVRTHPCPEVRARARALLLPWEAERVAGAARGLVGGHPPWLWEGGSWGGLYSRYMGEAREALKGQGGGPCWLEFRRATLLWVRGRVWARRPAGEIRQALAEMWRAESDWWRECPERVGPPACEGR